MADGLRRDDQAVFPVLEAVLVAILILSTILFFTALQRPTTATDEGGIDLGRLASDTLEILQTKEFTVTSGCPELAGGEGLEQWVGLALNGTQCAADEVESFLAEVLPPGTQFQVRLDNGVEPLVLVPYDTSATPRAARAAETYITPAWLVNKGKLGAEAVWPGQQLSATEDVNGTAFATPASVLCIKGPSGSSTGPGGVTWRSVWQPASPETPPRVPDDIPYGTWVGYTNAGCTTGARNLVVGLPDGTTTDYPIHGLQLVVWFGA